MPISNPTPFGSLVNMILRRGNVMDIFELSRLWGQMAREDDPELKPDLQQWRELMLPLMQHRGYFMFVAEEDDRIIGFIDYLLTPEPGEGIMLAAINFFYVVPEARATEAAGQLWKAAIESAKGNGASEFSSICFAKNLEFWEKHGFEAQYLGIRRVI